MLDANSLRELADNLRDKMDAGLCSACLGLDDKVSIVCATTKSAVQKGVDCGRIVKEAASMCRVEAEDARIWLRLAARQALLIKCLPVLKIYSGNSLINQEGLLWQIVSLQDN